MSLKIDSVTETDENISKIFIVRDKSILKDFKFSESELSYIDRKTENDAKCRLIDINRLNNLVFVLLLNEASDKNILLEHIRKHGNTVLKQLKTEKYDSVAIYDINGDNAITLALAEGIALSSYEFKKYKSDAEDKNFEIKIVSAGISEKEILILRNLCEAVFLARDLVNEPAGNLNAIQLSEAALNLGKSLNIKTEVFNKKKIESLKMEGLLAVNKGSIVPPTFTVMEWKPQDAKNTKPYVLVGKGVTFDTGGINLKPSSGLETMKDDMSGAASVIGTISAVAANKLPLHVVGLIPATDNRPGENSLLPGDILKMQNGINVEVINTDAEGRLILADALCFSKHYNPELVIDLATLTGNALVALGEYGTVGMGTADEQIMHELAETGNQVCERIVWFPFWEEYDAAIKSDIADIKNSGGREAGAITAGKFLSRFVDTPWIHLDIAGPAFLTSENSYRGKGGSGVGVRLLYRYFEKIIASMNG